VISRQARATAAMLLIAVASAMALSRAA